MSRVPASRITCVHYQEGNNRSGRPLWNNALKHNRSRRLMSRVPASTRLICVHHQRGNNRSGEAVVEQCSPTTRSLVTIYVTSTGIKRITCVHCQEATIVVGSRCETTLPNTIARDYLCREYRHRKNHMRALPRGNNRSGKAALQTTFPNHTITRDYLCREYRPQESHACITKKATIVVGGRYGTTLPITIARDDLCR